MSPLLALDSKTIQLSPMEMFTPHLETSCNCLFFWNESGWINMDLAEYTRERNNWGNAKEKKIQKHKRTEVFKASKLMPKPEHTGHFMQVFPD